MDAPIHLCDACHAYTNIAMLLCSVRRYICLRRTSIHSSPALHCDTTTPHEFTSQLHSPVDRALLFVECALLIPLTRFRLVCVGDHHIYCSKSRCSDLPLASLPSSTAVSISRDNDGVKNCARALRGIMITFCQVAYSPETSCLAACLPRWPYERCWKESRQSMCVSVCQIPKT